MKWGSERDADGLLDDNLSSEPADAERENRHRTRLDQDPQDNSQKGSEQHQARGERIAILIGGNADDPLTPNRSNSIPAPLSQNP
jgi:hypothetical protein